RPPQRAHQAEARDLAAAAEEAHPRRPGVDPQHRAVHVEERDHGKNVRWRTAMYKLDAAWTAAPAPIDPVAERSQRNSSPGKNVAIRTGSRSNRTCDRPNIVADRRSATPMPPPRKRRRGGNASSSRRSK